MKIKVHSIDNKELEEIDISSDIFGVQIRSDLIARLVQWQLSSKRGGNHKVKERNEIKGSTAKIYRQKGTGRARHGSKKVVQFRGGGVVHGPRTRDHSIKIPTKIKKLAMKSVLSSKFKEGNIIVLDKFKTKEPKTSYLAKKFEKLGIISAIMIDGKDIDKNFYLSTKNLRNIDMLPYLGANAYDIMRKDTLVFSKVGIEEIIKVLA